MGGMRTEGGMAHAAVHDEAGCSWLAFACSADILMDYGLEWVILGHSERRSLMHETSEVSPAQRLLEQ